MPAAAAPALAFAVLSVHVGVVLFNLFGLVLIPLGGWRGWGFVRILWWRLLHVAALGAVAGQAVLGRACFLTLWQAALAGAGGRPAPLLMRWVDGVLFWPLPMAFFAGLYAAVFVYVLALLWLVPPAWRRGQPQGDTHSAAT
jgi:hypothetical protein